MRTAIITFVTFAVVSPALADYHYASHQGSNTYPYTSWATAADVIYDAISAAEAGDTVYIGQGTWYEFIHLVDEDSNLAIIGSGWDETFLTADTSGRIFWCANNTLIQDLHIEQPYSTWLYGGLDNNVIVRNCMIENSKLMYISSGGDSALVENCIFNNLQLGAIEISNVRKGVIQNCIVNNANGSALYPVMADTSIIRNCILIDIHGAGVGFDLDYADSTLVENVLFYNHTPLLNNCSSCMNVINCTHDNTIFSNSHHGAILLGMEPVNENYRNNSISRTPVAMRLIMAGTTPPWEITASYFNLWECDSFYYEIDYPEMVILDTTHIQWGMPMFVSGDDYHLQAFSPLIDAGDPAIFDVDGSRSDIGVYGGPGGSSYQYLDLAPLAPDSISGVVVADTIFLYWSFNFEADFDRYQVHRENYSGFEPSILNLIGEPDTSFYKDTDLTPGDNYYYRVAAVDNQNNLSGYSQELEVITTGIEGGWGAEMPTIAVIETNYPNPFNSKTTIIYTVANLGPIPAQINIDIYDIMGRRVRNLVDERKEVGRHSIIWDGRTDTGSDCPSGVYFARISQWGVDYLDRHQKLVLLK